MTTFPFHLMIASLALLGGCGSVGDAAKQGGGLSGVENGNVEKLVEAKYLDCASFSSQFRVEENLERAIVNEAARNIGGFEENHVDFFRENTVLLAKAELSRGRDLILVYVAGRGYCGTGGCNAFVLEKNQVSGATESEYRFHMRIRPARLPIALLKTSHGGWSDLGVFVAGGGVQEAYMGALETNNQGQSVNPTLDEVHRAVAEDIETVLIDRVGLGARQCRLN